MPKSYVRPGTVYELMKEVTGMRISEEGAKYLAEYLTEMCEEIAKKAKDIASHAKRKTIMKEDIVFAIKNL